MTANALPDDRARSADASMQAHLTKPIDIARLYEVLGAVLAQRPGEERLDSCAWPVLSCR